MVVAGDPAADAEDEPAVAADEFGERGFIAAGDEPPEQLAIAGGGRPVGGTRAEVVHETVELRGRHSECPHAGKETSQPVYPRRPPGASEKNAAFGLLTTRMTTLMRATESASGENHGKKERVAGADVEPR